MACCGTSVLASPWGTSIFSWSPSANKKLEIKTLQHDQNAKRWKSKVNYLLTKANAQRKSTDYKGYQYESILEKPKTHQENIDQIIICRPAYFYRCWACSNRLLWTLCVCIRKGWAGCSHTFGNRIKKSKGTCQRVENTTNCKSQRLVLIVLDPFCRSLWSISIHFVEAAR